MSMTLRSPPAGSEAARKQHLVRELIKFFDACGQPFAVTDHPTADSETAGTNSTTKKSSFYRPAPSRRDVDSAMHNLLEMIHDKLPNDPVLALQQRREILRGADVSETIARMELGVGILWAPENISLNVRIKALEQLRYILDAAEVGEYRRRTAGVIFTLGPAIGMGISNTGVIRLDTNLQAEWEDFLRNGDFDQAREFRAQTVRRLARERELAAALGLQHILCEDSIASSDQYAYFLDTLQSAHGCMTWSKDQLSDLSLHVIGHGSVSPQPYTVHDLFGLMHVPASATRNELSEFILDKGDLARHRTKMYEDAAQQERATVLQCKRVLQLLALERDDDVSAEQMQHCCDRMLAASDQLAPLLRYMSIRVSNRFHMDDDDKTLYLKWNWM
eukprot:TRINITY_DN58_c0_g1_i1.p1 TRINITY_DN58_c0_g1~~TRINITY_DN58_c0_g1_i1.p1  ORF type:complete len:390 (+),score=69.13 TRINITY_DN58_c0_g1_i1:442-1611(+)